MCHKAWVEYLFQHWDDNSHDVQKQVACDTDTINRRIDTYFTTTYTTESDKVCFKVCTVFESYHYQIATPISDGAIIDRFFIIWLKRCVIPIPPHEACVVEVIYPAILLAHGQSFGLLPNMVSHLQLGLWKVIAQFQDVRTVKDKDGNITMKTPNPRI